jgi:hypothetical protein
VYSFSLIRFAVRARCTQYQHWRRLQQRLTRCMGRPQRKHPRENITSLAACVEKAKPCAQGAFVSYSVENADCSWYAKCDLTRLIDVGRHYKTEVLKVVPVTPEPSPVFGKFIEWQIISRRVPQAGVCHKQEWVEGWVCLLPLADPDSARRSGVWYRWHLDSSLSTLRFSPPFHYSCALHC